MPLHSYADLLNLSPSPQICKQYLFLTPDMQNLYRSPHMLASLPNPTCSPHRYANDYPRNLIFFTPDMQNLHRSPHMLANLPNPTCSPHIYANDYPQNIIFSPQTRKTSNFHPTDMQTTHRTSYFHPTHAEPPSFTPHILKPPNL